jgi:hypothetical protein
MEVVAVEKRVKINIYVEPSLWKRFREICRKKDVTGSWALYANLSVIPSKPEQFRPRPGPLNNNRSGVIANPR